MENLLYNISQVLGITIIHSLWQGLLIYCVLRGVLLSAPSLSSVKKYNLSAIALLSMAGWFVYTFCAEAVAYDWHPATVNYVSPFLAALNLHTAAHPDFKTTLYDSIKTYLPFVSIIYAIGLVVNLGRLGLAWNKIRVIKKGMIYAENLQQRINDFSRQLNISRQVKVGFSRLVDVPCVIGYFKPILLLPITLIFQLSAEEIETILLHELSHIKGNDYLVNLIQQIISVLLFFNPFAQFINSIISAERENRCDDIVVNKIGNPITYAYALLKLEEARRSELKLALAATQSKHHLLNRIERIMKTKTPIGNIRPILLAVLLIAASLGSIAWLNPEIKNGKLTLKNIAITPAPVPPPPAPVPAIAAPAIAVPHHNKITISFDTTRNTQLADTNKKKAKIKIVVEDENGTKHEYNSVNDMPQSVKDEFYKNNKNAGMNYKFDMNLRMDDSALTHFYNNQQWKDQVGALQDYASALGKQFNSPQWKKQMEDMSKQFNSAEWKKQAEDMQKQFNSPEWKKQMEDMQKNFNSDEWKKQVEDMSKQFNSTEWKNQVEDLQKQAEKYGTQYINSPEWRKLQDDIVKQAEEIAKKTKDPQLKKEAEKLKSMELKEKKEAPEKLEKKEKPEKKEAPEKPEKKEAPEDQGAYNQSHHGATNTVYIGLAQMPGVDNHTLYSMWQKPGC